MNTNLVFESNEGNNCLASIPTIKVTRPDLVETQVSNPPPAAAPGISFLVTDTVTNQGLVGAKSSVVRYYLSANTTKGNDTLLSGNRSVPSLGAGASSLSRSLRACPLAVVTTCSPVPMTPGSSRRRARRITAWPRPPRS